MFEIWDFKFQASSLGFQNFRLGALATSKVLCRMPLHLRTPLKSFKIRRQEALHNEGSTGKTQLQSRQANIEDSTHRRYKKSSYSLFRFESPCES